MVAFRLQVKLFLDNPDAVEMSVFIGLFQRWIQQNRLTGAGLMIDVADYRHVPEGPGVVLIGDESDYALDSSGGRLGLLYTRKRGRDADFPAQLRTSFYLALTACHLLETDAVGKNKQKLKFRGNEAEIRFADRLKFPNQPETFDAVRDDLNAVLAEIYGGAPLALTPLEADPRQLFTVAVKADGDSGVAALLNNFEQADPT